MDSEGQTMGLASYVDGVLGQCEIYRALHKAPQVPIAGASKISGLDEKLLERPPLTDDAIPLRAMDARSTCPLLTPVRARNLREVWAYSHSTRVATFGRPKCIRMDEGGEWEYGARAVSRPERRIKLQFQ